MITQEIIDKAVQRLASEPNHFNKVDSGRHDKISSWIEVGPKGGMYEYFSRVCHGSFLGGYQSSENPQLVINLLPHGDVWGEDDYSKELYHRLWWWALDPVISPWRKVFDREFCYVDIELKGMVFSVEKENNLLMNLFVALRSIIEEPMLARDWARMVDAGVDPAVAYVFSYMCRQGYSEGFLAGGQLYDYMWQTPSGHSPFASGWVFAEQGFVDFIVGEPRNLTKFKTPYSSIWSGMSPAITREYGAYDEEDYYLHLIEHHPLGSYEKKPGEGTFSKSSFTFKDTTDDFTQIIDIALKEQQRLKDKYALSLHNGPYAGDHVDDLRESSGVGDRAIAA